MRRCAHDGLTRIIDPLDILVDTRRLLLDLDDWAKYTGESFDAYRNLLLSDDPDEVLEFSTWRKAFLARYARQSVLQWDDVPVTMLDDYVKAVSELIKAENTETKLVEKG